MALCIWTAPCAPRRLTWCCDKKSFILISYGIQGIIALEWFIFPKISDWHITICILQRNKLCISWNHLCSSTGKCVWSSSNFINYWNERSAPCISAFTMHAFADGTVIMYYIMGDFQPCPPYVWNHKKYQIQPCHGIQSWWDSNDWLTKITWILIKLRLLLLLSHVIWLWFPRLHSQNMT